jgi:SAM-dependent methyltransferase
MLGRHSVMPTATGLKGLYLRLFGVPDVRVQLSASYALAAVQTAMGAGGARRVLDLGCGKGMITCLLAGRFPQSRVVGVDLDDTGLAFATRLAAENHLDNVSFEVGNAEHDALPGPNDLIVSLAVFQFIRDVPALTRRLRDALVPGGTLVLQLGSTATTQYLNRLSRVRGALPDFREANSGMTAEAARALLEDAGFEVLEMRPVIKGPAVLAKELFYATLSAGAPVRYALCPLLNWVTVLDRWYPGRGNGIFIVARRMW